MDTLVTMHYSGPRQVCVQLQHVRQVSGDPVPLHGLRGLRPVCGLLPERWPPSQDGEAWLRPGRGRRGGRADEQPPGGEEVEHPEVHTEPGPRLPVQRRQLPPAKLPQDEAGGVPHQAVQEEDQRRLPHLQTAHRPLLLPRQALPGTSSFNFLWFCKRLVVPCAARQAAGQASQSAACTGNQLVGSTNQLAPISWPNQ